MSKKVSKKVNLKNEPPKMVKISSQPSSKILSLSGSGIQVEMSAAHHEYVTKAFTQFEKAQKILEKYVPELK